MLALALAPLALYATFGRAQAIELCRRASGARVDAMAARLALELPLAFGIIDGKNLFVCVREDDVHRLQACAWYADSMDRGKYLRELWHWHANAFPTAQLYPSNTLAEFNQCPEDHF